MNFAAKLQKKEKKAQNLNSIICESDIFRYLCSIESRQVSDTCQAVRGLVSI
jgi:hypothetical protein